MASDQVTEANLRDCGYAPGNYENLCVGCGTHFIGDKRAIRCCMCAVTAWRNRRPAGTATPVTDALRAAERALTELLLGQSIHNSRFPDRKIEGGVDDHASALTSLSAANVHWKDRANAAEDSLATSQARIKVLEEALSDMLELAGEVPHLKGAYLTEKHGDAERLEAARLALGSSDEVGK